MADTFVCTSCNQELPLITEAIDRNEVCDFCHEQDAECGFCGDQRSWCNTCQMYSSTCCIDYGTCQCS